MSRLTNFTGSVAALAAIAMVGIQEITGTRLEPYILTVSMAGLLVYLMYRFVPLDKSAGKS